MAQMLVPAFQTREQLITTLVDIINLVAADDSFEGSLSYELPWHEDRGDPVNDPGEGFRVRATYRTGNTMGQGGLRTVGEMREVDENGQLL